MLERYQQAIKAAPDKKEREEIEFLKRQVGLKMKMLIVGRSACLYCKHTGSEKASFGHYSTTAGARV